jgi:hypothetical protein
MDTVQGAEVAVGTREFSLRYTARHAELMRRLHAEPRVSSVTFAMAVPGDEPGASIESGGRSTYEARFNRVDVDFFRAFDIPVLAGRGFEPGDVGAGGEGRAQTGESGAVVVNQSFALRVFGGDALGRRFRYAGGSAGGSRDRESGRWYEIAGIVRDFPAGVSPGMNGSPLKVYHAVAAGQVQPVHVALRVRGGDPSTFSRRLSEIALAVDPELHLRNIVRLDEALRKEQWLRRLEAAALGAVSLSVLMLSSAGIYALMSFAVSQRRKEIGIRMALGADRTRIIASIFSRALGQLAVGAALGMALAAMLENASHESTMRGHAAIVLPAVALFMMALGFLAALGPARRCLGIEPTEALREH